MTDINLMNMKNGKRIRRFATVRYAKRIVGLLIWYVIWGVSIYQYAAYDNYVLDLKYLLLSVGVLVLGYILFGIHGILMDNSYKGQIISVSVANEFTIFRGIPGCKMMPSDYTVMTLKINTADKGIRTLKLPLHEGYNLLFRENVEIIHYFGVPFPIIQENDNDENTQIRVCCICGKVIKDRCGDCLIGIDHELASENDLLHLARMLTGSEHKH
ncbi:MAG: hypothetical protein IKA82_03955 [Clostridia bacterium]|nr:hypothetical protein [Clostridia bacterium]